MNKAVAAGVLVLALTACGSQPVSDITPPASVFPSASSSASPPAPSPAGSTHAHGGYRLRQVHDPGQVTGTLAGPCHARSQGQLPDRSCTPGAYDPAVTAAVLCSPAYSTSTYRPPSSQTSRFKYEVAEPAYGQNGVTGELDHLVSLELGGANDASNLWVEAGSIPNPKDTVENALHDWVCSATLPLAQERLREARVAIAVNWMTAEQKLGISAPSPAPSHVVTHTAPPPASPPAATCYPTTPSGNCYEPGEFCSAAQHGTSGIAGDGAAITCKPASGGGTWHWET